ncbi:bi-functional transferase/deacetylase [Virgisporangium aurantiacum]|uniref:Bi-functional transferase/deacetylase n=1 Tax=Virgisporangium aurantiacum TaxID=175570 RepID=A0A8J4DYG4_9ACTN|nr:bi-functional transferase/deacetylase [Virgisporangium aurantiacum]
MLVLMFASVLMVEAYVNAEFAPDSAQTTGGAGSIPESVQNGGPIIDTTNGGARSFGLPKKTIALTFDDGPDPRWTPAIDAVLRKHHVPGTFFVVGTQVARHPDIVRDLVNAGDEIGIHSFTHPQMVKLPKWRQEIEYSHTQMAIVNATGRKSNLLRFPYSSTVAAIDDDNWKLMRDAGRLGYLTILTESDSKDWDKPGVDKILDNATPKDDTGTISLWHDAGGDRSQTVAALDRFIPLMKERGFEFVTVSEGLRRTLAERDPAASVTGNPPATKADRQRGLALTAAIAIADRTVDGLAVLFLIVGVLTVIRTLALFILAARHARKRRSAAWTWGERVTDPVSVIVPAYNEKEGIEAAVQSLADGDHVGGIEVVVVDDGSSDNTADLVRAMRLPNVRVVQIPNGGKPNALNTGVAMASHDLIVMVDGDTVFEKESLGRLVQPFADPRVGAVAGNVKVGNRNSLVARWQHIEYVIGFNLDRRLYDVLRCMPTIPGAIGAFRREALRQAGGMSHDTLAEDTDVTMALCRAGWHVVYEERARAWTEAPATLKQLWTQRYRWSYGTMQAMWKHRRSLFERGPSGRFGRLGLPLVALFGVALPLLAPIIDLLTIYGLVFLDRTETLIAWVAMLGLQFITAAVAFRLDKEKITPLWTLPLQQFAYRQLMYLVLIQSGLTALTGARLRWHKLRRAGTAGAAAPAGVAGVQAVGPVPVVDPVKPLGRDELVRPRGVASVPPNPYLDTPAQRDQDFLQASKHGILP